MTLKERRMYNAGYRRGLREARGLTFDDFMDKYGIDFLDEDEGYDFVQWAADQGYTEEASLPLSEWQSLVNEFLGK